ncbi:peptidylprolyl isomerase [Novosphingobium flavum]|uniref:Peptidyl-prolyl cis-trans isomerase n=1 Tax=Novosphingobium aerophilum TaxID=2839843 RepID=A0A7X1F582_9SPHN|nr:peptidylprolyl isomerase [Novosphingobium aerophilum]MBC2650558.1 peptidylprolyl isomerase [Novosphingobium aerophilum]MBC2660542.1 peptidylprolyl isomerase [Novosphingobium aerophilum]
MNRRSLFSVLCVALLCGAAPALAKDAAPVTPAAPVLSAAVDADPTHDPDNVLLLDLSNGGRVAIRLVPAWAPGHVERIKTLVKSGFYNGIIFHRVIEGFMAQTGDPTGTGQGGSQLPDLKAEFNPMPHVRGSVSMARTNEPDSANSQFFIVFYPRFALDRKYTNFGRVIGGMQYVDAIQRGEPPANPTKILQASLASEHKAQVLPPPPAAAPSLTGGPAPSLVPEKLFAPAAKPAAKPAAASATKPAARPAARPVPKPASKPKP